MISSEGLKLDGLTRLTVEIRWKGSKNDRLRALRKRQKGIYTRVERLREDGVVQWDEVFRTVCAFSVSKEGVLQPWEVKFFVFNGLNERSKDRVLIAGPAVLNLADFACVTLDDYKELEIDVPVTLSGTSAKCSLSLCLSLGISELKTAQGPPEMVTRPIIAVPLSPCFRASQTIEKDEPSILSTSLRKAKVFKKFVSARKFMKAYHGEVGSDSKFSSGSEDSEYAYPFDTDSFDACDEGDSEGSKEDTGVQKSFGYGTLISANIARGAFGSRIYGEDENWLYYSNHKLDVSCLNARESDAVTSELSLKLSPKLGILTWRKRKLSFRSPQGKGEPLLKKEYAEEGGDDIDFDRRQLSSSDESSNGLCKSEEDPVSSISEFGEDSFAIGSWECKEILSRDGSMKLQTQVFFASIDQRSETAAGESACTALVAIIADHLHCNGGEIPIKSEFDSLIREGSLQWRKLCDNEAYQERFPDKHFDLETVLQAKIRPLSIVLEKSFVGFFHPEGIEGENFDFLKGAMSFDSIWDEICQIASECQGDSGHPTVYIVSWNDHFFLLKVDSDALYIIDTLGERLLEGCKQAYVLKFDRDTTIERIPQENAKTNDCDDKFHPENEKPDKDEAVELDESAVIEAGEEMVVQRGKESCKEYIKSFLAAIPIRELRDDVKRGLTASVLTLHHRLQIEFHHTQFSPPSTV
ncbi:hypothetical protein Nepgr_001342 [Nepenthes gracilis]|uniref:C2 NT-type domain-containing protein n=1 Tax=Nepenthes gracilis TaxID=150966 RepID=A0AAD3P501_NEPGR|nr:hypothetical protein Nepgr_001342 [Nepenthes gracilis]